MATTTITTTAGEDARLAPAFGDYLGLRNVSGQARSATAAEIKGALAVFATQVVVAYENRVQLAAIVPAAPIAPT